jgi:signal transduction histidine kinase/ActR/RegA family two-component response regulator
MKTKKFPSSPIVKGTITMLHGDTCWIELEKNLGIGILHQEQSLARDKSEPLEKLDNYTIGKRMTVYITHLQNSHKNQDFWYVNERWASNNPWLDLKIKKNDEVIGTIVRTAKIGYFVQLDNPDIEVFLPQNQVPWSDGSLGEEPNEANISRLPLAVDDRIKAIVTEIHYPPSNPVISLSKYLAYQARSDQTLETKQTFQTPLQYSADIKGDLLTFQKGLVKDKLFTGKQFLIVDDDKLALDALANLLIANGAKVKSVYIQLNIDEVLQTINHFIEQDSLDLILIKYSLSKKNEGLQLAYNLFKNNKNQRIILYTGDTVTDLPDKHNLKNYVHSFFLQPLQLDKILACLKGQEYWETNKIVNFVGNQTISDIFNTGKDAFDLLNSAIHVYNLDYAVLIKVLSSQHLEVIHRAGNSKFPTEKHLVDRLLITKSDLRQLAKGVKTELQLKPNTHGNEGLKPYSKWAHFLSLGNAKNPSYILGIGWNNDQRHFLRQNDLWAFSLLIQTKLEHQFLNECLNRQLPFFIQGQLLSGLTHEIRNRFSPWVNYQQTLREYWQQYKLSEADERQALEFEIEKALDGMETAYDRLDELMDLMLGGLRQSGVTTSIKTLLEQIKQLFTTQLRQHGIVLHIKPAPDITLGFSPLYLLQSLSNLILNTRKHMHRHTGGKVEIITKIEEIPQENDSTKVLSIYVADNGPGIPSHFVKNIFTPGFSQAVKPEERTGMGLYISRFLLQQIGGNVELIDNWRGIGCVFRLQLPLQ